MLALLRGVSRSFYVSIRLLPAPLRRPVAVAYLLARAADTLADSPGLPSDERREKIQALVAAVDGRLPAAEATGAFTARFAGLQHNAAERDLLDALPWCLSWLEELGPADREDVRAVMRHITRGQELDIDRFAEGTTPRALESSGQLDEYTYLVAGCVGEFWTNLCFRHVPGFASLPRPEMHDLGRAYGMGLQLVNILRDVGPDLAAGRCYFPLDELAAAGLRPEDILSHPDRFEPIWERWSGRAHDRLELGARYADAVGSRRVRAASALPALVGFRTLALLRAAGPMRARRKVKVPRHEVRSMLARLLFTLAGRAQLRALFDRVRDRPPGGQWDNGVP
jgi:farnesyl-diphosphate farnesyltransferase